MSKGEAIIRTRDPETLEMEYAIGLKEAEARRLRDLLTNENFKAAQSGGAYPWDRILKKLQWVIETAAEDRRMAEERARGEEEK